MSELDDALEARRIAEREITFLEQELLDEIPAADRAAIQARLGDLTLTRNRIVANINAHGHGGVIHAPSAEDRQRLAAVADALDRVAAGQQRASAIIATVTAAVNVFAT